MYVRDIATILLHIHIFGVAAGMRNSMASNKCLLRLRSVVVFDSGSLKNSVKTTFSQLCEVSAAVCAMRNSNCAHRIANCAHGTVTQCPEFYNCARTSTSATVYFASATVRARTSAPVTVRRLLRL